MKQRHMQEMAPWPDEQVDGTPVVTHDFWRGLVVGVPLGAMIWTLILWGVW